jgi:pimeloyl-ACP methyl ester carboxylesterase
MKSPGNAPLSFSDLGAGVPVVFLHPTPLDREYWRPLAGQLVGVRAILPDLRGHGLSPLGSDLPKGGFPQVSDAPVLTMRQLAQDVLALLDHLHIEKAVFAGCSIGGYVLLELWRQAPERVRGLALICSKPQPDAPANAARRAATIAEARAGLRIRLYDSMVQTLTGATARSQHPEMVAQLRQQMDAVTAEALVAVQAGLATRPDSVQDVATISVPVLAIVGGEDPGVTADEMRVFEQVPGGCSFHLLATAGHFAAFEQPAAVSALVQPWLQQFTA